MLMDAYGWVSQYLEAARCAIVLLTSHPICCRPLTCRPPRGTRTGSHTRDPGPRAGPFRRERICPSGGRDLNRKWYYYVIYDFWLLAQGMPSAKLRPFVCLFALFMFVYQVKTSGLLYITQTTLHI